jgi:hypothetical protein
MKSASRILVFLHLIVGAVSAQVADTTATRQAVLLEESDLGIAGGNGCARCRSRARGFGISIGSGYNQLFWRLYGIDRVEKLNRVGFSWTPTVRLQYVTSYRSRVFAIPFVEYNVYGGRRPADSLGYTDQCWFHAIASGVIVNFRRGRFALGLGVKANVNVHFVVYRGSAMETEQELQWSSYDWTADVARVSADGGLRFGYSISWLTISFET